MFGFERKCLALILRTILTKDTTYILYNKIHNLTWYIMNGTMDFYNESMYNFLLFLILY